MTDPQQVHLNVELPPELRNGVHAELAAVWHTREAFTIDFISPISPSQADEGGQVTQAAQVVARVRVPTSVIFNIARAISDNVAIYESTFGTIGMGGPDHPPAEGD